MDRAERFRKIKLDVSLGELRRAQSDLDVSYQDLLYMDIIYFHPETTVSYIADALNIAGTAVTVRLNRMERNGWITRTRSERDRRQYIISLTGKAMEMYREYEEEWSSKVDALCAEYSEEEADRLLEMLERLTADYPGKARRKRQRPPSAFRGHHARERFLRRPRPRGGAECDTLAVIGDRAVRPHRHIDLQNGGGQQGRLLRSLRGTGGRVGRRARPYPQCS